jgi:hypothetical protein
MKNLKCILLLIQVFIFQYGFTQKNVDIQEILSSIQDSTTKAVLANPATFRYQIVYTQINRDKNGVPHFKNYTLQVDPDKYFNPASMVKMPLAFLSLEKLHELNKPDINKHTTILFDSSYQRQVSMYADSSSKNKKPSIAHLYQFIGQGDINKKLLQKGYSSTKITRQFMGYTEDQNRHTNGIRFVNDNNTLLYEQAPQYNTDSFSFGAPILIGNAHWNSKDELVQGPFDFTKHNNISLEDMQKMLQAIVFPTSVPSKSRFNISEEDRQFLLQFLSQYPSETNYPKYDTEHFHDSYVKFFFQDSTHSMPKNIRVFNKVGWAYGFLTDVSYVLDTLNNIDYMLSATVYVNSDGVVNDSKYDEETVGFPFLKQIGNAFYEYELKRKRNYHPILKNQVPKYEERDQNDTRPSIKNADN